MDYLVTVNPYFIDLLEKHGIDRDKVDYIPNYVSDDTFYQLPESAIESGRKKYGLEKDDFVTLGVGQVQTRKGVLDFIDIAIKNPEKKFIWAGGFSFGAITDGYNDLKTIVENPPENVTFLGIINRDEMNMIYNISDVLFMPSYNELFPMAILEAMSVGKPILLRDLDIYIDILDGYYLKGNCSNSFSNVINQLDYDQLFYTEAAKMSKMGSVYYSKKHVLEQWESLYGTLSEGCAS